MFHKLKELIISKIFSVLNAKRINVFIYYLQILFDVYKKLGMGNQNPLENSKNKLLSENLFNARAMARDPHKPENKRVDILIKLFFCTLIVSYIVFIFCENQLNGDARTVLSSMIGFCYDMLKCIVIFEVGGGVDTAFDDNGKS